MTDSRICPLCNKEKIQAYTKGLEDIRDFARKGNLDFETLVIQEICRSKAELKELGE